mmetsp:Transcript_22257/g.63867  ORF Transcript_22257/g.63867 Transcript_22257/m.63867 type:complete len:287 (+) Transcript_22257:86-946(+)
MMATRAATTDETIGSSNEHKVVVTRVADALAEGVFAEASMPIRAVLGCGHIEVHLRWHCPLRILPESQQSRLGQAFRARPCCRHLYPHSIECLELRFCRRGVHEAIQDGGGVQQPSVAPPSQLGQVAEIADDRFARPEGPSQGDAACRRELPQKRSSRCSKERREGTDQQLHATVGIEDVPQDIRLHERHGFRNRDIDVIVGMPTLKQSAKPVRAAPESVVVQDHMVHSTSDSSNHLPRVATQWTKGFPAWQFQRSRRVDVRIVATRGVHARVCRRDGDHILPVGR